MNNAEISKLEHLLSLNLEELYPLLIPQDDLTVYSKNGAIARGTEVLRRVLPELRSQICSKYKDMSATAGNIIDLAVLLSMAISGIATVMNIPVLPLSAIITKIGLEELCRNFK